MLKRYNKPPLTFDEQLSQLQERGLQINNPKVTLITLSHISYYRLSAYWHPYRKRDLEGNVLDEFVANALFEEVLNRYEFDRKLRLLILDAIERIEVSLRTRITYYLAHQYGVYGHTNPANFHPKFWHQKWLEEVEGKEALRSQEEFIRHFKNTYQGFPRLPIWVATEIISLGALSRLFEGLWPYDRRAISEVYGLHPKTLVNWLHVLTYVRNICAHHARLWNRQLAIRPALQGLAKDWMSPKTPCNNKLFIVVLILKRLLDVNHNGSDWQRNFEELMSSLNQLLHKDMGFPDNWQKHSLWV